MADSDRNIFQEALSDFTFETACGGAIRHLADSGCTAKQIMERLDYPISEARVRKALYKHLCDTGVILEKSPEEGLPEAKPEYIVEYNSYGKPSYRRKYAADVRGDGMGSGESGTGFRGSETGSGSGAADSVAEAWKESVYKPVTVCPPWMSEGTLAGERRNFGRRMLEKVFRNSSQSVSEKATEYLGRGAELDRYLTGKCNLQKGETAYFSCDFGLPDSAAAKGISLLNGRQQEYLEGILWPRHRVYHRLDHRMKEILCSLYEQYAYEGICYFLSCKEKLCIIS